MDISILSQQSLKIRGKLGSFIVDPDSSMSKNNADGVLLQTPYSKSNLSKVLDHRIVLNGPGDYEVSGIKISSVRGKSGLLYRLAVDDVRVFLGKASGMSSEEETPCDMLLLDVDSNFSPSLVAAADPRVLVLYGKEKEQALKALGKEAIPVKKFATTKDKLPSEMEVVVLG